MSQQIAIIYSHIFRFINDTSLITAFASINENLSTSVSALTGASTTSSDNEDETMVDSWQQCYAYITVWVIIVVEVFLRQ